MWFELQSSDDYGNEAWNTSQIVSANISGHLCWIDTGIVELAEKTNQQKR